MALTRTSLAILDREFQNGSHLKRAEKDRLGMRAWYRTIGDVSPNYGAGQCTRTFVGPSAGATVARNVVARMSCPGEHSFPQATLASGFVSVKKIIMSLLWIPYVESLCFKSGCGLLNGGHSLPRGAREVWPSEVFADDKRLSCG